MNVLVYSQYGKLRGFPGGFSDPFAWISAAMVPAFVLAPVWLDWQLRRLEVADELVEWSESDAKQRAADASSP